ncbi:hypothetical protein QWM81_15620 [Streptomyces ficellus]|uniref:Integral membrane protein n=1 Tax=Streptomyces ficellus TaxID=1977088 RepID=A0ABT7Z844_9ACTN|nr:hypothetical protein [Streptomyces ficellus]MDN3295452.1 hypothetical protein [Streptomyces ficellus]
MRRFARREWGAIYAAVTTALVTRTWRAVAMTLGAVCLTAAFQLVQNQPWGLGPVHAIGAVRAEDPLWTALLRTPLSLFVPALDLPVWGALAQILLVFGIAEICLGRLRTLLIAYAATLGGTLYARIGIALGPDAPLGLGLPASDAAVMDTGPSAAVVGLAVFVCWHYRAWLTGGLVVAAMVVEVLVKCNLAGKEHLAAIVAVLVVCAVASWRQRRSSDRSPDRPPGPRSGGRGGAPGEWRSGSTRSGAPAIRS